ncbi:MAG TPA: hypothetical protein VER03_08400, partial [Bryobacteraceae bacterium]|nr:hypothetical protein [Bryobacteraceae bacterium]
VYVHDVNAGTQSVARGRTDFELVFPIPAAVLETKQMIVTIETERTVVLPSDTRQLGLGMGTVTIVPPRPGVR